MSPLAVSPPRLRTILAALVGAGVMAACGGGGGATEAPPAASTGLATAQAGELRAYVQARLRSSSGGARGATDGTLATFMPAPAVAPASPGTASPGAAFSGTQLQEAGVDEPDLLKTDGSHLYTLQPTPGGNRLQVYARAADGSTAPLKSMTLGSAGDYPSSLEGMVLAPAAAALAIVSQPWQLADAPPPCAGEVCPAFMPHVVLRHTVAVQRVDVARPAEAIPGEHIEIDGRLVDSRRVGDALVVVTAYVPRLLVDTLPATATAAQRETAIAAVTTAELLPRLRRNGGAPEPLLAETDCWLQTANASAAVEITTITVFDLKSATLAQRSRCFVGGSEALYMTPDSLYLATTRWTYTTQSNGRLAYPPEIQTDIHKFGLSAGLPAFRASASVPGHLGWASEQKSYRLSEWNGDLRVLTYTAPFGWAQVADAATAPSPAQLTVLREAAGSSSLQTVATLPNTRRPEAIGKPGEQVYGVRFLGARGYVVTFRQTDPLYVLDLADPADPRIAGALEVPGFSSWLYPLDGGLLLGVGRDADATGRVLGIKLGLFDVADAARPREIRSLTLGGTGSSTALDGSRHGLNYLMVDGVARVALPASLLDDSGMAQRALLRFEVDTRARSLVALGALGTRTDAGGWAAPWQERSVQIDAQVYHLREDLLTAYDW